MNIQRIVELSLLLLSFTALDCFSSTAVTLSGKNGDLSYTQFNETIGNDQVTLVLRHGEKVDAKALYVTPDTVSWVVPESQVQRKVPTNSLHRVVSTDHGLGALIGLGIGGVCVTGILFTTTRGVTGESGELAGPAILIGGGGAALLGGVVGGFVGMQHGYEFSRDSLPK